MAKHMYHFRLDPALVQRVDALGSVRTRSVELALQQYLGDVTTMNYNRETVDLLKNEIQDLQTQRDVLQRRLDYYSLPWYIRIFKNPLVSLPAGTNSNADNSKNTHY